MFLKDMKFDAVNAMHMCADMLRWRKELGVNMILEAITLTYSNLCLMSNIQRAHVDRVLSLTAPWRHEPALLCTTPGGEPCLCCRCITP